jgi:hypothetical protein
MFATSALIRSCLFAAAALGGLAAPIFAQDASSAAPAKELSQLLADKKLDSIASRMASGSDEFAAALAFPGQLMVVWAKTSAPALLNEKLLRREYRDVYVDLNSASIPESRHFVTDIGADGLKAKGVKNQPIDSHDVGTKTMRFDGNWKAGKMSEQEYMAAYAQADAAYTAALQSLLAEIKKGR